MVRRKHRSASDRLKLLKANNHECHICHGEIQKDQAWDVSHEIPLELGGADDDTNAKPAHHKCHKRITAERDQPDIAKAKRRELRHNGIKKRSTIREWRNFRGERVRADD